MKRAILCAALLAALSATGCKNDTDMCKKDADCYSLCVSYAQTNMLYACTEDKQCVCADAEERACDITEEVAAGEKSHCEKFCEAIKPNTNGVCSDNLCECVEKSSEPEDGENTGGSSEGGSSEGVCAKDIDCFSVCKMYSQNTVLYACSEGMCSCLDKDELTCDPDESVKDGEKTHCEKVCEALKPGTTAVCASNLCECQAASQN